MSLRKSALATLLLLPTLAWGATYYVDGGCPTAGNGTSASCLSSPTTNNPKILLSDGIALLSGSDDVLNVRGVHSAHDNCPGTDGRYDADTFVISGKNGTSGHPIIVQNYNFAGTFGTGETVYIQGVVAASTSWVQCSDCSGGSADAACRNIPGTCADAWHATLNTCGDYALGAVKPDLTPTYRVFMPLIPGSGGSNNCTAAGVPVVCCTGAGAGCGLSDLTNSHTGYDGTSPEIDSFSMQEHGSVITVKWGQGANAPGGSSNPKPYIFCDANGNGFQVKNSTWITIRGFDIRNHERAAVSMDNLNNPTVSNIVVTQNRILYNADRYGQGSDYGVVIYGVAVATVTNNEIGWVGSEGLHTQAPIGSASALLIDSNWIHDMGDNNTLGQGNNGTAHGLIIGSTESGGVAYGDYTGTILSNNLIKDGHLQNGSTGGIGIDLENSVNNAIVRNNVVVNITGECMKMHANSFCCTGPSVNSNQVYNNLMYSCGANGADGHALWIGAAAGFSANNNLVYNNTFALGSTGGLSAGCGGATCTGNIFRNNILYDSGSKQMVNWAPTGIFQNNLVYSTTAGTLIAFNGKNSTCAQTVVSADVDNDAAANDNDKCADPLFISGSNFHIQTSSPAKDAGTSAGMPAGRTTDINNTIASLHGLVSYADANSIYNGLWDLGADEYFTAGPPPIPPQPVSIALPLQYCVCH